MNDAAKAMLAFRGASKSKFCTLLLAAVMWAASAVEVAFAAPPPSRRGEYIAVDLGTLGGSRSEARDINNRGVITGYSNTNAGTHAVTWRYNFGSSNHLIRSLGEGGGYGISGGGKVVGHSMAGATMWAGGDPVMLGTNKFVEAISGGGLAVGWMPVRITNANPVFVYNTDHGISFAGTRATDLAPRPESFSRAYGVSDGGTIVGWGRTNRLTGGPIHAWMFPATDLHTLVSLSNSVALAANNNGQVVGYANNISTGPFNQPMFWSASTGMRLLVTPPSSIYGSALGMNNRSQAVGVLGGSAVLWSNLGESNENVIYLNDLLVSGSGWTLQGAYAINDRGEIVGYGRPPGSGQTHGFVLAPTNVVIARRGIQGSVIAIGSTPGNSETTTTTPHILQEVQVELLMAEGGALTTLETSYTDAQGAFSFEVIEEPTAQFAIKVTLQDGANRLRVIDVMRDFDNASWLITPPFSAAKHARADIAITINANLTDSDRNDTTYSLNAQNFVPAFSTTQRIDPNGVSNAGADHFAHLAVIYRNIHLAASFAVRHLGLSPSRVDVYAFSPSKSRTFYSPPQSSLPAAEIVIAGAPEANNSLYNRTDGLINRPDNREFHEYSHHIMTVSPIGGVGKLPPYHEDTNGNDDLDVGEDTNGNGVLDYAKNHDGIKNYNSTDSWVEGFAAFMSAVISDVMLDRAEKANPAQYRMFGVIPNLEDLYRFDDPARPGRQFNGILEEFIIASLLWDLYDPVDTNENDFIAVPLPQLWGALSQLNLHFAAVHDSLLNLASNSPAALDAAQLEARFIAAGIYDDYALTPGFTNRYNGVYDPGELVGITAWNPSFLHRNEMPLIPGSLLRFNVVDMAGNSVPDATLSLQTQYDPPYADRNYEEWKELSGAGPSEIPLHLPPLPARVRIRAHKGGVPNSAELVVTSEFFWEKVDPLRPGGVTELLMQHTFVLDETAADLAITVSAQPGLVAVGVDLTYSFAVTNRGSTAATGATLVHAFPPGASFVSASASQGSCAFTAGIVACNFGTVSAGASATATIIVTPITAGSLTNTFNVTATETDANMANNVAMAITKVVAQPTVTGVRYVDGSFSFSLATVPGCTYVVEYKDDLSAPAWEILATLAGDGTSRMLSDPAPVLDKRFYRVRIE